MSQEVVDYFSGDSMASDVWSDKYCLKDSKGTPVESTPKDMHWRMAKEFARIEFGYCEKELTNDSKIGHLSEFGLKLYNKRCTQRNLAEGLQNIEQEFFNYFNKFGQIVPQGSIMSNLGNFFIYGSLSNCFGIASPYDSYGGIMKTDEQIAQLEKRRGGVGCNISTLRPYKATVTNAAKSSTGAPSFAERYSNTTREVAQEGRRGALMLLLRCEHPDIFKFASMKDDRTKVTGANVSVMFTDEFMYALENNQDFVCRFPVDSTIPPTPFINIEELDYNVNIDVSEISKKNGWLTKSIMKIKPQELFDLVAEMAWKNAEPGVAYYDRVVDYSPEGVYEQYKAVVCNPCVVAGTEILTPDGYYPIEERIGLETHIWNGFEWSIVTPKVTGHNQHTIKVTLSDGRTLTSTDYHKWYLAKGYRGDKEVKQTKDLKIGDKIIKYNFPIIKEGEQVSFNHAYTQGFISADGQDENEYIWLYEPKFTCLSRLDILKASNTFTTNSGVKRLQVYYQDEYTFKNYVPFNWCLTSKIEWLAGLLDGDGTELVEGGCQLWSVNKSFLEEVQKFLSTLGVNSKVLEAKEEGFRMLPDGKGGGKEYLCQKSYRITLGATQIQELKALGLSCERLKFDKTPNRDASQFVKVVAIEDAGYADEVYCFDEPLKHYGVFNGILTGQCGEQWFAANETCRLIALNFWGIVNNHFETDASIDYDLLYELAYMQQRLGDNLVDLECEYIDRILDKISKDPEPMDIKYSEWKLWIAIKKIAEEGRRTGGGFTALGDMLAALGVRYDDDYALATVEEVMKTKMRAELDCTIDMAILRGPFVGWDKDLEFGKDSQMIELDTNILSLDINQIGNSFFKMLLEEFPEQAHRMWRYGRRNTNWSTVAPTGTVSLMCQSTSGLEPLFKAYYIRRKKINPSEPDSRVDFTDDLGDKWQEYAVLHPKFKEWCNKIYINGVGEEENFTGMPVNTWTKDEIKKAFESSPWYKSEADDISWEKRVDIQAIIQRYTSNAISSTINLPQDVPQQVVKDIYLRAYHKGLKGVTVYRDGSRSGVLITETKVHTDKFGYSDAVKRPKELEAHYYTVRVKGDLFAVVVGLLDGLPYELFAFENPILEGDVQGKLIKIKRGVYEFRSNNYTIENVELAAHRADETNLTRFCSQMLRHGVNPKHIVEQVEKSKVTIVSFPKAIAKVLKRYIPDEATGETCNECGQPTIIYEEGCKKCTNCGSSKC